MHTRSQYSPRISVEDRNTRFVALMPSKQLPRSLLVAAAHPERHHGELRIPSDLDVRIGAQLVGDPPGQVELLVQAPFGTRATPCSTNGNHTRSPRTSRDSSGVSSL